MRLWVGFLAGSLAAGCAGVSVVPADLKDKVDRNLSFEQVKASPLSHKGAFVVIGGAVLSAKPRKQDGTQIEVLQLPLDSDNEPISQLTESKGRFLARYKQFIDPATIPLGTRVTVVGEVTGSTTLQMDEIEYVYPTVDVAALTIWPPQMPAYWVRPYPYFGPYWGPYWGPFYGPYYGPYFGPPVIVPVPVPTEKR